METDRKAKLAQTNHWDELLALRDRQREQARSGIHVIKQSELPLEVSKQGLMRWYLHPAIKDTCLSVLLFLAVLLIAFLIVKLFGVDLASARGEAK